MFILTTLYTTFHIIFIFFLLFVYSEDINSIGNFINTKENIMYAVFYISKVISAKK